MSLNAIRKGLIVACAVALAAGAVYAQRVKVADAKFTVDGSQIWMNAVNTPWQNWNDLGGNFDPYFWDQEFSRIKKAGGNATRIWITCNGETGFDLDGKGGVRGMTEKFWEDADALFEIARKNRIYVLATLISFDHTKDSHPNYRQWRNMYESDAKVGLFVSNYVRPFVERYKANPWLFAIEPCNEIEWAHEEHGIPWERLQYFCGRVASAVHAGSEILVTVGNNVKWQSSTAEGEFFSDENLRKQFPAEGAYLDFYSPHFYDWVIKWFGSPFADRTDASYKLAGKPAVIGECPANADWVSYQTAYKNGWEGVFAWTSNTIDGNGGLDGRLGGEMRRFRKAHPELVDLKKGK